MVAGAYVLQMTSPGQAGLIQVWRLTSWMEREEERWLVVGVRLLTKGNVISEPRPQSDEKPCLNLAWVGGEYVTSLTGRSFSAYSNEVDSLPNMPKYLLCSDKI
jgi:hypothetical protein